MARSHSTDGKVWTNPEVKFERSDVEGGGVVTFGVVLTVGLALTVPAMFWLGSLLLRWESPRKVTDLPPAAVDADRLPPEPRLEFVEKGQPRVTPPRAADLLAGQRRLLEDGDPKRGIEPIESAINALAGKLPARGGAK
jgi:hypothetical protein